MSKANQAFKQADEAVSPVIGVILMVAITVVLAAVVFVLVSNLSEGGEDAPKISFTKDSGAGTLTVTSVSFDGDVTWGDLVITGCTPAGGVTDTTTMADLVTGGQQIGGCDGRVTVVFDPTDTLIYETTF